MINLVGFGTLTSVNRTEKTNTISNPISSNSTSVFEQSKDKRDFTVENQVAYANPFSFESLFGGQENTASAFAA